MNKASSLCWAFDLADEQAEPEKQEETTSKPAIGKTVVCRLCKGAHYTAKCPYKEQLAAIDSIDAAEEEEAAGGSGMGGLQARGIGGVGGGKYVPV